MVPINPTCIVNQTITSEAMTSCAKMVSLLVRINTITEEAHIISNDVMKLLINLADDSAYSTFRDWNFYL